MALELAHENIWYDKWRVEDAERQFYEKKCMPTVGFVSIRSSDTNKPPVVASKIKEWCSNEDQCQAEIEKPAKIESSHEGKNIVEEGGSGLGALASQIAMARQEIQNSLAYTCRGGSSSTGGASADVLNRLTKLEGENTALNKRVQVLEQTIANLTKQLGSLQVSKPAPPTANQKKPEPKKQELENDDEDDEEIDLFGSDSEEEDANAARVREERLKAYAEKKSKKPGPIAKSSVLLDCKPWDDETDMKAMENEIRKIEMDGLLWGAAKLVPLAFGINKLSILCTVEDEKVSIDDLSEKIQEIEDYVQSVDIAAFNKI